MPTSYKILLLTLALSVTACDGQTDDQRIVGELASDRMALGAENSEPIVEILVEEGVVVSAGDALVRQDDSRARARLAEIVASVVRRDGLTLAPETVDLMARERLGVTVRRREGRTVILHGGDNGGYRASLTGMLETRAGAVVLTNGRSADGLELRRELAETVLSPAD